MSSSDSQVDLLVAGMLLVRRFCEANFLEAPKLLQVPKTSWRFDKTCAYYRPTTITLCLEKCARPGLAGAAWSWPGYVVDRTPYGVVCHELGHHVDHLSGSQKGSYWSEYGSAVRLEAGDEKLTSYCPNDAEWFAEMFRLFVTNPDLLRLVRPNAWRILRKKWSPVLETSWEASFVGTPPARTLEMARKKFQSQGSLVYRES